MKHLLACTTNAKRYTTIVLFALILTGIQAKEPINPENNSSENLLAENESMSHFYVPGGIWRSDKFLVVTGGELEVEHHSGTSLIVDNEDQSWTSFKWYHNNKFVNRGNYLIQERGLNGVYSVVATDKEGNEVQSENYFHYTPTKTSEISLIYYPVPIQGGSDLTIFYNDLSDNQPCEGVKIFDSNGKQVYYTRIKRGVKQNIYTDFLKPGEYTIKTKKTISTFKVI